MNLSKLQEAVKDREPGVLQSMGSQRNDSVTEQQGRVGVSLVPRPAVTLRKASQPAAGPLCTFYRAGLCDCVLRIKDHNC